MVIQRTPAGNLLREHRIARAVVYAARGEREVMRHAAVSLVKLVQIGMLASCSYPPLPHVDVPREVQQVSVASSRDLDLLFLIDDSPSMADKQVNLATSFPNFIQLLSSLPGGLPSVHIGVATSDMGTQAALDATPGPPIGTVGLGGCSGLGKDGVLQVFGQPVTGAYLSDIANPDGTRTKNYTGDLATVFGNIAKAAGAKGCGFEQHLAAVQRALTNPANQGFLRDTAYLGIIVLADEDDCSLAHTSLLASDSSSSAQLGALQSFRCTRFGVACDQGGQTPDAMNQVGTKGQCHPDDASAYLANTDQHAAFLRGVKAFPGQLFLAAIAGNVDRVSVELRTPAGEMTAIPALAHSCSYVDASSATEVADPAIRIKSVLDQFPGRSAFSSICEQDLSGALMQIGDLVKTVMGPPCFLGQLLDEDPGKAGSQYDCAVSAVDPQTPAPGRSLPACDRDDASATNPPCWHIAADATSCPKADHLLLRIEGQSMLAAHGYVTASCALVPAK
jgi:hypothetical protein